MELYAKKSLGQHFLNSKHVLGEIIAAAALQKGENVLEIGPGTGILTEALLEAGANVVAIEKDRRAINLLRTKFEVATQSGQLKVIEGDVLEEDLNYFDQLINQSSNSQFIIHNSFFAVVANIPYYITGAILEKFLEHDPRPNRMVLLVQKEVAERIVVVNGKESILSISVKAFGTPKLVAKVPRGAFTPAPTVDSAILSISNISNQKFTDKNIDIKWFFTLVHAGFAHKRKFLIRNLENVGDDQRRLTADLLGKVWTELEFDTKVRAEDLTADQWFALAEKLL